MSNLPSTSSQLAPSLAFADWVPKSLRLPAFDCYAVSGDSLVIASYQPSNDSWLRVYKISELIRAKSKKSFGKDHAALWRRTQNFPDTAPLRFHMCSNQVVALGVDQSQDVAIYVSLDDPNKVAVPRIHLHAMGLNGANSKRLTELRGPRYAGLVRRSRQLPQILGDIVAIALTNDDNMFGGAVIPIATRILVWNWVKNILVASFEGPGLQTCRLISRFRILLPRHGGNPALDLYEFDPESPISGSSSTPEDSLSGLSRVAVFGIPKPKEAFDDRYLNFLWRPQGEQESSQTIIVAHGSLKKHIVIAPLETFQSSIKTRGSKTRYNEWTRDAKIWDMDSFEPRFDPSFTGWGMIVPSRWNNGLFIDVYSNSFRDQRSGDRPVDDPTRRFFTGFVEPVYADTIRVVTARDDMLIVAFWMDEGIRYRPDLDWTNNEGQVQDIQILYAPRRR